MFKNIKKYKKDEKGTTIVGVAIIYTLIFIFALGGFELFGFISSEIKLKNLSREAIQYLVEGGRKENVVSDVIEVSDVYKAAQEAGIPFDVTAKRICECSDGVEVSCNNFCVDKKDSRRFFYVVKIDSVHFTRFVYPSLPSQFNITAYTRVPYFPY